MKKYRHDYYYMASKCKVPPLPTCRTTKALGCRSSLSPKSISFFFLFGDKILSIHFYILFFIKKINKKIVQLYLLGNSKTVDNSNK